ncbi:RNA recognition motif protein [Ceratobasidium sp. AG-Ba]|nr:RNA recognition motif protein [Ceratobasidium sp. AG-Ba]
MNGRHHPYGGYDEPPRRRSPPPERYFDSEGGGRGRGRGGRGRGRGGRGGGRGGHADFDPPFDGPYNGPSDPYFNGPSSGYHENGPGPGGYGDDRGGFGGGFEDHGERRGRGRGGSRGRGGFRGGDREDFDPPPRDNGYGPRGGRAPRPSTRDDAIHDDLIEQRIKRERPCRTLFIRNIKYETDSDSVRRQFEEFGEIKTFFDLISTRGMVFVTYVSLSPNNFARLAQRVTFTTVFLAVMSERGDGTLHVILRQTNQPIDDHELRRRFGLFGDVKQISPADGRSDQRLIEFYDSRAMEKAHDHLQGQPLQDGVMHIEFAWDVPETPLPPGPVPGSKRSLEEREYGRDTDHPPRGRGRGRGRGGRGDYDSRDRSRDRSWERDRRRSRSPRGRDRDDYGRRGGRFDMDDARGGGRGSYASPPRDNGYQGSGGYGAPGSSSNAPPPVDDRLEQAKKVQQLLAALKQPQESPTPPPMPPPTANVPPPSSYSYPPPPSAMPPFPPTGYPGPPPGYPPYAAPVSAPPPPTAPPHDAASQSATLASLPPSVLALLQQASAAAASTPPQQQPNMYGYGQYPPPQQQQQAPPPLPQVPAQPQAPAGNTQTPQAMQQLMALLSAHGKRT